MKPPFTLPVRIEDDVLLAADNELICGVLDATGAERSYIVRALNSAAPTIYRARIEWEGPVGEHGDEWVAYGTDLFCLADRMQAHAMTLAPYDKWTKGVDSTGMKWSKVAVNGTLYTAYIEPITLTC